MIRTVSQGRRRSTATSMADTMMKADKGTATAPM